MNKSLAITQYLKTHKALVVCLIVLIIFTVFTLVTLLQIEALKIEEEGYKTQIAALEKRSSDYERTVRQNVGLVEENTDLRTKSVELYNMNNGLTSENEVLAAEYDELNTANAELEIQSVELVERFDELGTPN